MPARRRQAIRLATGFALLGFAASSANAQSQTVAGVGTVGVSQATQFIRSTGEEMVAIINDPGLNRTERRNRAQAILRRTVDIEGVGRFVSGRHWRTATQQQQQDYLDVFDELILRNLAARFGELQGINFRMQGQGSQNAEDVLVTTVVERPNSAPANLQWRVGLVDGAPKIVDLVAEGTSLRLTTRSDYGAVLQRSNGSFPALIEQLKAQLARLPVE